MKIRALLAAFIAAPSLLCSVAHAETITLAADVWCPYNCAEGGYMVEIARDIFQKNNIDIEYRVVPWKDAVEKTRAGDFDAIVGATHDDAPDFVYPTALQGMSDMRFWVLESSSWLYSGMDSLAGVRLAVIEDYAYSKELNAYIKDHKADAKRVYIAKGSNALGDNLKKLKAGEVTVIAEDDNVINYYISSQGAEYPIKSVGTPIKHEDMNDNYLYIAFSPKNPNAKKYAAMLDSGMKELRDSGELHKILDLYHVSDWYGITKQ